VYGQRHWHVNPWGAENLPKDGNFGARAVEHEITTGFNKGHGAAP